MKSLMGREMRHKFNQAAFDDGEAKSRQVVMDYYTSLGINIWENPDRYGIDLLSEFGGIELERRSVWWDKFPFPTLHIPYRKKRLANPNNTFIILNKFFNKLAVVNGIHLKDVIVQDTPTVKGEKFFDIPLESVMFISLEEENNET
jgi:hypothetical protein